MFENNCLFDPLKLGFVLMDGSVDWSIYLSIEFYVCRLTDWPWLIFWFLVRLIEWLIDVEVFLCLYFMILSVPYSGNSHATATVWHDVGLILHSLFFSHEIGSLNGETSKSAFPALVPTVQTPIAAVIVKKPEPFLRCETVFIGFFTEPRYSDRLSSKKREGQDFTFDVNIHSLFLEQVVHAVQPLVDFSIAHLPVYIGTSNWPERVRLGVFSSNTLGTLKYDWIAGLIDWLIDWLFDCWFDLMVF